VHKDFRYIHHHVLQPVVHVAKVAFANVATVPPLAVFHCPGIDYQVPLSSRHLLFLSPSFPLTFSSSHLLFLSPSLPLSFSSSLLNPFASSLSPHTLYLRNNPLDQLFQFLTLTSGF
jgi:hypothetical protein